MSEYSPRDYWACVADDFGNFDEGGLAPVLHPNAPEWYNTTIDAMQFKAILEGIRLARLPSGAHFLDVGCGTGRWLRRYEQLGFRVTGVDATARMLTLAKQKSSGCALVRGESFRLPFSDCTFDAVSDVTVIQHIVPEVQPLALAEILRVIRPGGRLILMELIRGKGSHIFPHAPHEWIEAATSSGAKLITWFGQEFMIIDRAFNIAVNYINVNKRKHLTFPESLLRHDTASKSRASQFYWKMRRVTAPLSARMENVTRRVLPGELATHGVFIFSK